MADDIAQELSQELDGLYGSDTEPAQPAQPIKADYTSIVDDIYDEPDYNAQAKNNLDVAFDKNPDEQVEVFNISKETGVHPELVDRNLAGFKRKKELSNIDLSQHPTTAKYFSNPKNALVSKDDIQSMMDLEDSIKKHKDDKVAYDDRDGFWKNSAELLANRMMDIGVAGMQGMNQLEVFTTDIAGAWAPGGRDEHTRIQKASVDRIKDIRFNAIQRHTPEQIKESYRSGDVSDTLGDAGLFIAETGIQSLGDWAVMRFNFPAYIMARSVEIGEENARNNNKEADLGDTMQAMPFAIASALLDRLGMRGIVKAGKESVKDVAEDVSLYIAKQVSKESIKAGGKEAATEFLQEGVIEYAGERWGTDAKMDIAEAFERGAWASLAGGGMGTTMATVPATVNARSKRIDAIKRKDIAKNIDAAQEQIAIDSIISYAQSSNTNTRAVDQSKEFVDSLEVQKVIITSKGIESAIEDGHVFPGYIADQADGFQTDIEISAAEFAADIASNPELLAVVRPHLKMNEDSYTQEEMSEGAENYSLKEMLERSEKEAELHQEVTKVYETVKDQLKGTGRQSEETSRVSAQLYHAFVTTYIARARDIGAEKGIDVSHITPEWVFENKVGLTIVGPRTEIDDNGEILEQGISAFNKPGVWADISDTESTTTLPNGTPYTLSKVGDKWELARKGDDPEVFDSREDAEGYFDELSSWVSAPKDKGVMVEADEGFNDRLKELFAADIKPVDQYRSLTADPRARLIAKSIGMKRQEFDSLSASKTPNIGKLASLRNDIIELDGIYNLYDSDQGMKIFDQDNKDEIISRMAELTKGYKLTTDENISRDADMLSKKWGLDKHSESPFGTNTRSINAAFDPDYAASPKLLAQGGEVENTLLSEISGSAMIGEETLILEDGDLKVFSSDSAKDSKRKSLRYVQYKDGKPVGALQIGFTGPRSKKATIQNVYVRSDMRREKIAAGLLKRAREDYTVKHSDDLTDAGKLFAAADGTYYQQPSEPLAEILLKDNGERIIKLREASDLSSFLHESGHLFLEIEKDFAKEFGLTKDQQTMLDWMGVESMDDIGVEQHEKFAETFEVYLMTGKAPSLALRDAFARFKVWLTQIYGLLTSLKARDRLSRADLSPEISEVMDRLLATQSEIDEATANPAYEQYFRSKEQFGRSDAEWEAYQQAIANRDNAATESIDEKLIKELTRQKTKEWVSESREIQKEEEKSLALEPVYQVIDYLRTGKKLDREMVRLAMGLPPKLTPAERYEKMRLISPEDSILVVAAKSGGLDYESWVSELKDKSQMKGMPVVGMPAFKKKDGLLPDQFVEIAKELNFGQDLDIGQVVDMVQAELDGTKQYSPEGLDASLQRESDLEQGIKPELTGEQQLEKDISKITVANDGIDAEDFAFAAGFESAAEMVNAVLNAKPLKQQAKENAHNQMLEKYGDILNDGTIEQEVREAVNSEEQSKVLLMEVRALGREKGANKSVEREQLKAEVEEMIDGMTYAEIKPNRFYMALQKAGVNAAKAEDKVTAQQFKIEQLINHYAYKYALETKDRMMKQRKHIQEAKNKKYNPKEVHPDYIAQISLLVNAYDMRRSTKERKNDLSDLLTWYNSQVDAAESLDQDEGNTGSRTTLEWLSPELIQAMEARKSPTEWAEFKLKAWDDLTASELQGLYDTVKHLRYVGGKKSENAAEDYRETQDRKAKTVIDNSKKSIPRDHESKIGQGFLDWASDIIYSHRAISGIIDTLNGFNDNEMFAEDHQSIVDSTNVELELNKQFSEDMNEAFKPILKSLTGKFSKVRAVITKRDGEKWSLSHRARFVLALNMGNESNRDAVLQGLNENYRDNYTESDLIAMMETMSKEELVALNAIWAAKEKLWPLSSKVSRKLSGVAPIKLEPTPFKINGVDLTGGHLKLNYKADSKDAGRSEVEIKNVNERTISMTKAASQIERVGSGGREVDLEALGMLFSDVQEDIHYIAWAETAANLSRTFKGSHNPVVKAIQSRYGKPYYNNLVNTIDGIINPPPAPKDFAKAARYVRSNLTYAYLAYSVRNILQQPIAITNTLAQLGEKYTALGVVDFYKNPIQNFKEIDKMSTFMNNRTALVNREAREQLTKIDAIHPAWGKVKEMAFLPQTFMDALIAYPTWMGAYRKFKTESPMKSGDNVSEYEKKARGYADQMVQKTIGSGLAKDVGNILSRGEGYKQLTFMGTFFNVTYNMHAENAQLLKRGDIKWYEYARRLGWMAVAPAIISAYILDDIPEDDDEYWGHMLFEVFKYNFAAVFGLRELSSAMDGFTPNIPGFKGFEGVVRVGREAVNIWNDDKDFDIETAASIIRGLEPLLPLPGSGQVARVLEGYADDNQGIYGMMVEGKERN